MDATSGGELLALSLLQPWLWAILEGYKTVENRPWKPWPSVIGKRIALHASLGYDKEGARFVNTTLGRLGVQRQVGSGVTRGAILGTAVVVGAVRVVFDELDASAGVRHCQVPPVGPITGAQFEAIGTSPWTFGPWAWLLEDVHRFAEPIPCKGALGLWRVPPLAVEQVRLEELRREAALRG